MLQACYKGHTSTIQWVGGEEEEENSWRGAQQRLTVGQGRLLHCAAEGSHHVHSIWLHRYFIAGEGPQRSEQQLLSRAATHNSTGESRACEARCIWFVSWADRKHNICADCSICITLILSFITCILFGNYLLYYVYYWDIYTNNCITLPKSKYDMTRFGDDRKNTRHI